MAHVAVHWFRKGLRLHDNPALLESIKNAKTLYPSASCCAGDDLPFHFTSSFRR
jgi:deoxyribodipyrimidine photolyase